MVKNMAQTLVKNMAQIRPKIWLQPQCLATILLTLPDQSYIATYKILYCNLQCKSYIITYKILYDFVTYIVTQRVLHCNLH